MPIPKPNTGQTKGAFMKKCIPFLKEEGMKQGQAVAVCSIEWEKHRQIQNLTQTEVDRFVLSIWRGQLSLFELFKGANDLFMFTFNTLEESIVKGFGGLAPKEKVKEFEKAMQYRQNIGKFSGAKTFTQAKELTDFAFLPNGTKRPFKEFREFALERNDLYNKTWLKIEQDTVFSQSQNAKQMIKVEAEADVLPFVKYQTIGDARVRDSHAALNGLVFKVGDPKADEIAPQNSWGCRCQFVQLDRGKPTSKGAVRAQTKKINEDFAKDPAFKGNLAKKDYVFKEKGAGKHNYFNVPRQFKSELKDNFGFKTPQR